MRILSLLLFVLASTTLRAQSVSVWKHVMRPDFSFDLYFYSLADSDTTPKNDRDARIDLLHWGSSTGMNLPFVEIADDLTAGLSPNVGLTLALSSVVPAVTLELPVYATLKFNTDATWKGSKTPVGLSAGIGYHHTVYGLVKGGTFVSFGRPVIMAELNFGKRRSEMGLIKFRYTQALGSHTEVFPGTSGGQDGQIVFTRSGFHLIFTPAY